MVISSNLKAARKAEKEILREVAKHGYAEACTFAIRLALEEGLNNAITHGNRMDPTKTVQVDFDIDAERAQIIIADQGEGFMPQSVPDPTVEENIEKPCGRGIMLMRAYMDVVEYDKNGTRIRLVKRNAQKG